jgi:1-phosphatidylinositol phosphodiesterase
MKPLPLPLPLALALLALLLSQAAVAHDDNAYSHDANVKAAHPAWMAKLSGKHKLSELSLPGTHDAMAHYGGDIVQTQTLQLADQLKAGIRVLDIRCRHYKNACAIHHGAVYQHANLDDVLTAVTAFLAANKSETVLMLIRGNEHTAAENTRSWEETFEAAYVAKYPGAFASVSDFSATLDQVRGKIVLISGDTCQGSAKCKAISTGNTPGSQMANDWVLKTNWDLQKKWDGIDKVLKAAVKAPADGTAWVMYLSGSTGSMPYFVASGHSSPGTSAPRLATGKTTPGWKPRSTERAVNCLGKLCTVAFEGLNTVFKETIAGMHGRVGLVFADFPGPGLIEGIIAKNPQ